MEISNDQISLKVHETGAEIFSLKYLGKELIWQKKKGYWPQSAPILFPFCGFLKDGFYLYKGEKYEVPVHGFASSQNFNIESYSKSKVTYSLCSNEQTLALFPFKFHLTITYELQDSELLVSFTVKNIDKKKSLPYSIGWHPGFKISKNAYLKFSKNEFKRRLVRKGGLIGSETKFSLENHSLHLTKETLEMGGLILENQQAEIQLIDSSYEINFNLREFPNLVIWGQPGANFICIEPWYGMGDLENHDYHFLNKEQLISLKPSEEKTLSIIIKIKA